MRRIEYLLKLFFLLAFVNLSAQKNYSLADCITAALQNNINIQHSNEAISEAKVLKNTAIDIPKTTFQYTQGQFNSIYPYDNILAVNQTFPFPTTFIAHSKSLKGNIDERKIDNELLQLEIIREIKIHYYTICYLEHYQKILNKEEETFNQFSNTSSLNDTANIALDKAAAETRLLELSNQFLENKIALIENYSHLKKLLHVKDDIKIDESLLGIRGTEFPASDSVLSIHPLNKLHERRVINSKLEKNLAASHLLPDITLGYFNQSIYGPANVYGEDYFLTINNRLQGFQASLAIPIFIYPQQQKVKALQNKKRMAELEWKRQAYQWNEDLKKESRMLQVLIERVNQYEKISRVHSEELLKDAATSLQKGKISAIEYLEVVNHSFNVDKNYLTALLQYQCCRARFEYFQGK